MSTLHWDSRNVWGLMPPRTVQLWNVYAAMINGDRVAWPSLTHLKESLCLKDKGAAIQARRWLLEHGALEIVRGYSPPNEKQYPMVHDRRMFVRLTGVITIEETTYKLLYFPGEEAGSDTWREGEKPTLVGKIPLPRSENSHQHRSENSHQHRSENSHPNVVQDKHGESDSALPPETDGLPDHVPPSMRRMVQLAEVPRPNGDGGARAYSLIEAYLDAWDVKKPSFRASQHRTLAKQAALLADMEATPDEVRAMVAERRAKHHQMSDFPMAFLLRDYVPWKSKQEYAAPTARVLTDTERAERDEELEAERRAWRAERGLA